MGVGARGTKPVTGSGSSSVLLPEPVTRERRVADLVAAGAAAIGIALLVAVARPPAGAEVAVARLLAAGPALADDAWRLAAAAPMLLVAALSAHAAWRRRLDVLATMALAALSALATAFVVNRYGPDLAGAWSVSLDPTEPRRWFPAAGFVLPGAAITAACPHLAAPARRLGTIVVVLAAASLTFLAAVPPTGAMAGLLTVVLGARVAHGVLRAPTGEPDPSRVVADLAELGIRATGLDPIPSHRVGVRAFDALDGGDRPILVRISSSDARDARLAGVALRRAWYRHVGEPLQVGRLRAVQHEALQTLLARESGVPTDDVLRVGRTSNGDALLVTRPRPGAGPLRSPTANGTTPLGPRLWPLIGALHDAGLTHGQLDLHHLTDDGSTLGLTGFDRSTSTPTLEHRRIDQAQALVTAALADGPAAAISDAHRALGDDGLLAVSSFVQPAVLTRSQNAACKASGTSLGDLRSDAAQASAAEAVTIEPIRRLKILSAAQAILLPIAVMGLWGLVRELDLDRLGEQVAEASWLLLAVGLFTAQLPRVAQVFSSLGVAPVPLPLWPLYALQLSVSYVNLVIPGGAARVAITVRFYQRHGLPPGSALAVGAIDGLSGLATQIVLVAAILLAGTITLDLDLSGAIDLSRFVAPAIGVVVVLVIVLTLAPGLRRAAFGWLGTATGDAFGVIRGLTSPRRWALIGGGNLAAELFVALALASFVRAFGYSVGFGELLLITMTVSVLAWVIPVPGGIGVSETGLVIGLIGAGLPEEGAFAAMVVHRLATFYLPPIWGFFALRWLERNQYL